MIYDFPNFLALQGKGRTSIPVIVDMQRIRCFRKMTETFQNRITFDDDTASTIRKMSNMCECTVERGWVVHPPEHARWRQHKHAFSGWLSIPSETNLYNEIMQTFVQFIREDVIRVCRVLPCAQASAASYGKERTNPCPQAQTVQYTWLWCIAE